MLEMVKLIPEATSAIAVICVVILFLRQQSQSQIEFTKALEQQRQAVVDTIAKHLDAISEMLDVMRKLEATVTSTNSLVVDLHRVIHDRLGLHYEDPGGGGGEGGRGSRR
jgi:hypothetical protein